MVLDASKCDMCLTRNKENNILNVNDKTYKLAKTVRKTLSKAILSGIALHLDSSEAVTQACSVKKVFLEISQNSQENTYARVSILIKLQAWGFWLLVSDSSKNVLFSSL